MSGKTILAFQISETVSGEQFIRLVDIDGRTLSFYENGTREMGANRLYQIATALHVNANDLDLEWMGCTNVQTRMDDEMVGMFTGMSVANSHFLRTAGSYFPDSPGHIKRTAWDISRAEGTPPY